MTVLDLKMRRKNQNPNIVAVVDCPKIKEKTNERKFILNPWFITGLVDAEGSFVVNIVKDAGRSLGFVVLVYFEIALNEKDQDLLIAIKEYFGVGNISFNSSDNTCKLKVAGLDGLRNVIIPHFKQFFLLTKKRSDFELFSRVVEIMINGDHLNLNGLREIVNIKASLNLGLSDKLKGYFPEALPVVRPVFNVESIPDPHWLAGFV